jgi:MFS family permease
MTKPFSPVSRSFPSGASKYKYPSVAEALDTARGPRPRPGADDCRYFNRPVGLTLGIITAALFLPAIIFSFVGDALCQRFGRKITVFVGSSFIIVGGIFNAFAADQGQFAGGE